MVSYGMIWYGMLCMAKGALGALAAPVTSLCAGGLEGWRDGGMEGWSAAGATAHISHLTACIYCIPEYGDFSTAEIGSHRLMNIFLIFFSLVPKINRHGLMLCHVMPIRF